MDNEKLLEEFEKGCKNLEKEYQDLKKYPKSLRLEYFKFYSKLKITPSENVEEKYNKLKEQK